MPTVSQMLAALLLTSFHSPPHSLCSVHTDLHASWKQAKLIPALGRWMQCGFPQEGKQGEVGDHRMGFVVGGEVSAGPDEGARKGWTAMH